jgi:gallate dioxygenase
MEGSEVIMWLIMRGALAPKVQKLHQAYYLPSMTPIATVIFEDDCAGGRCRNRRAYRARIQQQWNGLEKLPGTYPFTLDRSVKAYRLNSFLHSLLQPERRKRVPRRTRAAVRGSGALSGKNAPCCAPATGAR